MKASGKALKGGVGEMTYLGLSRGSSALTRNPRVCGCEYPCGTLKADVGEGEGGNLKASEREEGSVHENLKFLNINNQCHVTEQIG